MNNDNDTRRGQATQERPKMVTETEGVASVGARFLTFQRKKDPTTGTTWLVLENKKGYLFERPDVIAKALDEAMKG